MVAGEPKAESLRARYCLNIEQLDYKYVRECKEPKVIERILLVLRSGQEGIFPDLIRFTEEKLRNVKPNSALLRFEQPAKTIHALDSDEKERLLSELKQWKSEVSVVDAELKSAMIEVVPGKDSHLPPVRGTVQMTTTACEKPSQDKLARISSLDYASWERYDVDAQLNLLDESEVPQQPTNVAHQEGDDPAIEDQPDVSGLSQSEKAALALREKEKGNEYFRDGDFSRAAIYYTRSISAHQTVAAYNNRAQANLNLKRHGSALMDCGYVLCREPQNVKALLRRGIARQMGKDWIKARLDFQQVLQLEPHNVQAKQRMAEVEKSIIGSDEKSRKKMLIQEVDSIKHTDENEDMQAGGDTPQKPTAEAPANAEVAAEVGQSKQTGMKTLIQELGNSDNECENRGPNNIVEVERDDNRRKSENKATLVSQISSDQKHVREHNSKTVTSEEYPGNHILGGSKDKLSATYQTIEKQDESTTMPPKQSASLLSQEPEHQQVKASPSPTSTPKSSTGSSSGPAGHTTATLASASPPPQRRQWTTFEFMRQWRSLRSSSSLAGHVQLLRSVRPHQLAVVFGSQLDAVVLSTVIRCVLEVMLTEDGPQHCQQLLEHLSGAERFHVVKGMLDRRDQERLAQIASQLQRTGVDVSLLVRRFTGTG